MAPDTVVRLDPEGLRTYLQTHPESDYLLIDVRQPREYGAAHIPGAYFLPLMEFEARLFHLPADRDLIFYCHSGGRSAAAATLALDAEITSRPIYNLDGGIMAWDGMVLEGYPRLDLLDSRGGVDRLLHAAMDLEKGAWRFYQAVCRQFAGAVWIGAFRELAEAETAHARLVYRFWSAVRPAPPPFDVLFDGLEGRILEGGLPLDEAVRRLAGLRADDLLGLVEMALGIEAAAYDLYRVMAEREGIEDEAREALLAIAQAEKGHIRRLIQAMEGRGSAAG
jgi:rhodanese-related sulfurtransferase/rubrerythrin